MRSRLRISLGLLAFVALIAARASNAVSGPLGISYTVGTGVPSSKSILVFPGADVNFQWQARNTGTITYTQHTLVDSVLGNLPFGSRASFLLPPGTSVTRTINVVPPQSGVYTSTWYASDGVITDTATDAVRITIAVPSVALTATVGDDPSTCASFPAVTVFGPGLLFTCYRVTNTGTITFTSGAIKDLGTGRVFTYTTPLGPGASVILTDTIPVSTTSMTNMVTTTADGVAPAFGQSTYTVTRATGTTTLDFRLSKFPNCATSQKRITVTQGTPVFANLLWRNFTDVNINNQSAFARTRGVTSTLFSNINFPTPPGGFGIQTCEMITQTIRGRSMITVTWTGRVSLPFIVNPQVSPAHDGVVPAAANGGAAPTFINATDTAVLDVLLPGAPVPLLGHFGLLLTAAALLLVGGASLTWRRRARRPDRLSL